MNNNLLLIATTEDVLKYADKDCVQAEQQFSKEFRLKGRPFVNYFFHMLLNGETRTSVHWNYGIFTSADYGIEPDLGGMVDKYLHTGFPDKTIQFAMPPLIITNQRAKSEVLEAFAKAGYNSPVELQRV